MIEMLTPLERVELAFLGEPDRVPVFPLLGGALRRLVGMTWRDILTKADPDFMAEIEIQAQKIFGFDVVMAAPLSLSDALRPAIENTRSRSNAKIQVFQETVLKSPRKFLP